MPDEMFALLLTVVLLAGFVCWVPCLRRLERRLEARAARRQTSVTQPVEGPAQAARSSVARREMA